MCLFASAPPPPCIPTMLPVGTVPELSGNIPTLNGNQPQLGRLHLFHTLPLFRRTPPSSTLRFFIILHLHETTAAPGRSRSVPLKTSKHAAACSYEPSQHSLIGMAASCGGTAINTGRYVLYPQVHNQEAQTPACWSALQVACRDGCRAPQPCAFQTRSVPGTGCFLCGISSLDARPTP